YRVYMPGIGGTGVVTANQVLAYAAMMEGLGVHVLDQTGLAQKGGAVLSSLTVFEQAADAYASNKVGLGRANLVVGLDTLGVVNAVNADRMSPERTVVVADSTLQPTAEVVRHVNLLLPGKSALQRAIDAHSRASENLWVEAGSARWRFWAPMPLLMPRCMSGAGTWAKSHAGCWASGLLS